jgi:hypothetical protein
MEGNMAEEKPTTQELEDFVAKLNTWGQSLPRNQQALLHQLLTQATGALPDKELEKVVGGVAASSSVFQRRFLQADPDPLWCKWALNWY